MDAEKQYQIRKIQRLSAFARGVCTFLGVLYAIATLWFLGLIILGPAVPSTRIGFTTFSIASDQLTTFAVKATIFVLLAPWAALLLLALLHLRRLFDNFTRGVIYARESVRHVRRLGYLALVAAIMSAVWQPLTLVPIEFGIIDERIITRLPYEIGLNMPASFVPFFTAGLVLLIARILDVGRQTSEEAERLRSDAELVI